MAVDSPNYTEVPNQLLGDILKGNAIQIGMLADMGLAELKVFLAVCRLTFGYHQTERRASLTTLQKLTGLSRQGVLDGAADAERRGIIERVQDGGVTLWRVLVKPVDQSAEEVVKPVDQVVKPVDRSGQASRPPSKKETRNKPKKETKERGAAEKTPPAPIPSHDPTYLPTVQEQLPVLFPHGQEDPDYEQVIQRSGWRINNVDHRRAMALFLEASQLDIPFDKSARKDWLKQVNIHLKTYGLDKLREMYPRIVSEMREDGLPICRPGSLTNLLADMKARDKNGGKNAQPTTHPRQLTEHQKGIAAALRSTARNPGG